jgi:Cu/Ag efflux protein CusF
LKGEVVYLYRDAKRVVIRHEAVPGWSRAAITEIPVRDEAENRKLKVGQRVTATVVAGGTSEYLEGIEIAGATPDDEHRP